MSQQQMLTAAMGGIFTRRLNDPVGPLASIKLLQALFNAFPSDFGGAQNQGDQMVVPPTSPGWPKSFYGNIDLQFITGPVYSEVNGGAADATKIQHLSGSIWQIRNCWDLVNGLFIYAPGAYDIRVRLYTGGTP